MNAQQKAMLASYGRSFLAAVTATFMATGGDFFALDTDTVKAILASGIAAVLPVALRYINKKDPAFGKIAEVVANEGLEKLRKKAPVKKSVAKKKAK
ncbi:MAG: hypothetical protein EBU08_09880 [Micrococcales bacterium]|nr:hypothetical protein [Micrococcales bacterium]